MAVTDVIEAREAVEKLYGDITVLIDTYRAQYGHGTSPVHELYLRDMVDLADEGLQVCEQEAEEED